jgi:unsaturated chondroitin disaccharide hydrolase
VESNHTLTAGDLLPGVNCALALAADKTLRLDRRWKGSDGAPVITIAGRYAARSWTQWTQGFQYGNALLCFDLTDDPALLAMARKHVVASMAEHLTHTGVHDHGFNNISTYGHLRRLMLEGRIPANDGDMHFYELALKVSGAVQAARWTGLVDGLGYIYSFNGSHSLFIDTIRTLRICCIAHMLGHSLQGEQDERVNLLSRALTHAITSARYNIYYGEGRDRYDVPALRGRTVHEAVFNPASGIFRCPSTQQGYSAFTTWTRGLAWGMLGYAELMEFVGPLAEDDLSEDGLPGKTEILALFEKAARAECDFYMRQAAALDGICYWDTGAPQLYKLGDWQSKPADPYNEYEPVDASASAIAAQGLLRLGHLLGDQNYTQAGLTVAARLLQEPYLSVKPDHEGLLLQSIYHHPNGWDFIPPGAKVPCNEASMWGDYHLLELCLLITRMANGGYYTFFEAETKG